MREKITDAVIGVTIALVVFLGAHLLAGCGQLATDSAELTCDPTLICDPAGGPATDGDPCPCISNVVAPLLTKIIAPKPTGIPTFVAIDIVGNGVGNATVNIDDHFVVGDHLHAVREYITDNTMPGNTVGYTGPTKLVTNIYSFSPPNASNPTGITQTLIGTSNVSNGSGTTQILTISGLDIAISPGGTIHSIQTIDNIGVARSVVWSFEIDYDHP